MIYIIDLDKQIKDIIPDINLEQLDRLKNLIYDVSYEYAQMSANEAVNSAISSYERFGR